MTIKTDRLILRHWQGTDRDAYAALMADPVVRKFYPSVLTREEADTQMDHHLAMQAENPFHFRAAIDKQTNAFVGLVGLAPTSDLIRNAIPTHPEVEIGWVFNTAFWGQGLAPEAASALLLHAWEINLPEVVAFTAAINTPSQRVMEKIGMTRDPAADFPHPRIAETHPLHAHIVYRVANPDL